MHNSLFLVFQAVSIFLRVIYSAIIAFSIMSWFRPQNGFYMFLGRFIAPFVMPFRRLSMLIMRKTRVPVDFSTWFAIISLMITSHLWSRLYVTLSRLIY